MTSELGRYGARADHGSRMLADPEDASSWVFIAIDDGAVLASTRITCGGQGLSPRQVAQYQLTPFLDELGPELLAVGERTTVHSDHRGTPLLGAPGRMSPAAPTSPMPSQASAQCDVRCRPTT